uniref:Uncharacterized protein n=1 Tax=Amphimedon queenslandica TaxID=400682 RepID=A0A1X7TL41_AMPQE
MATSFGAQLTATRLAFVYLQATLPTSSSATDILRKIFSLIEDKIFTEPFCKFNSEVTLCLHDLINAKELIQSLKMSTSWADSDLYCIPQQSLFEETFGILVKEHCATEKQSGAALLKDALTLHKKNSMRYVCSYVVHTLLKKYENKSSDTYSQYEQCLGQMTVTTDDGDELEHIDAYK